MNTRRRFMLSAAVSQRTVADDAQARAPRSDDAEALARIMLDAYRDTVDDEGETLADARAVIRQLFGGEFGEPMWDVSEVVERAGRVVAATLLTRWEGAPFIAFTLTAPVHQGRGLGRAGLVRAINRLAQRGESLVRLVVTQGNEPAERLYERLGFKPEARPPFEVP